MKHTLKKILTLIVVTLSLIGISGGIASAATVYYKNSAVHWDYGRLAGLWSYSNVQSSVYDHSATANGVFSGWRAPGSLASARAYIGTGQAQCYWNCRG